MDPNQEKDLNIVEILLRRSDLRVEFSLTSGQMLFTNNHWILHNRTSFEDYLAPKFKRHYIRSSEGQAVTPQLTSRVYVGFAC